MNDYNFIARHFPAPDVLDVPYVGIDVSPSAVRLMEIIDVPSRKVGVYAEAPLSTPFLITEGDNKEVKDILKKWKKDFKLQYIKASIPEEKAYLFDTEIEFGDEEKMRTAIEFSLEEHVPLKGSEVIFDYRLVGESPKKGFINVAVTVLPSEVVYRYADLFEECELTPISFLIEAQAVSRALIRRGDKGTYLIVNIRHTRTGVFIVSNGAVQFTSTLQLGSYDFTKSIMAKLGVNDEDAKQKKHTLGFVKSKENDVLDAMLPTALEFKKEIEKVYIYWSKHKSATGEATPIQKVIVSGSEAITPGFKEFASQMLKVEVEIANVWNNLASFDEYVPPLPLAQALNFGAAIGLALPEKE